jgi:hypothetical protein
LHQISETVGVKPAVLARWMADSRFSAALDGAMLRRVKLQKMELMLQQSVAAQQRAESMAKGELKGKAMETACRQINQELHLNCRQERELRKALEKQSEDSDEDDEFEPHPHLDAKAQRRMLEEMDRIQHLAEFGIPDARTHLINEARARSRAAAAGIERPRAQPEASGARQPP